MGSITALNSASTSARAGTSVKGGASAAPGFAGSAGSKISGMAHRLQTPCRSLGHIHGLPFVASS
jgi:hypothetical protein